MPPIKSHAKTALTTYVALLRAVNVAGHQIVAMADLRAFMEDLGLADGRTLLQSGNLIFRSHVRTAAAVEKLLEAEAGARLGLNTDIYVRTGADLADVIAKNPFPEEAKTGPSRLIVSFLRDAPEPRDVRALQAAISGCEILDVVGRHAYVVYPDGVGKSKLTSGLFERKLGTRGTGRNWNTVMKLHALAIGAPIATATPTTTAAATPAASAARKSSRTPAVPTPPPTPAPTTRSRRG
jgi:uncharacterized protein (DUF1697 family)